MIEKRDSLAWGQRWAGIDSKETLAWIKTAGSNAVLIAWEKPIKVCD